MPRQNLGKLLKHTQRYRMTRKGESMTSLVRGLYLDRAVERAEVETTTSTSRPSTLMTCSETLTSSDNHNTTATTPALIPKPIKRDTLTATSKPTKRPSMNTRDSSSRGPSVEASLTTCLRTWRRCSRSTHMAQGPRAGSTARANRTVGPSPSAEATWFPPSQTAPKAITKTMLCYYPHQVQAYSFGSGIETLSFGSTCQAWFWNVIGSTNKYLRVGKMSSSQQYVSSVVIQRCL